MEFEEFCDTVLQEVLFMLSSYCEWMRTCTEWEAVLKPWPIIQCSSWSLLWPLV